MNGDRTSYEAELHARRNYLFSVLPQAPSELRIELVAKKQAAMLALKQPEEALPLLEAMAERNRLGFLMLV